MSASAAIGAEAPTDAIPGVGRAWPTRLLLCAGAAAWILGLVALARQFVAPVGSYDEGHFLTDAMLVARGQFPYADFYTNYPPPIFWLVAAVWEVTGESLFAARVVGALVQIAAALLSARLVLRLVVPEPAGRAAGDDAGARRAVGLFASGIVFLWWRHQPLWPTAFAVGVTCLWCAWDRWIAARENGRVRDALLAGFAFGCVGAFRHDLFVYACGALAGVVVLDAARTRLGRPVDPLTRPRARVLAPALAALCVPLAATWGVVLVRAGVDAPLHDLVLDPSRYMVPARKLPFPSFERIKATQVALVLVLAGPVLTLALWRRVGARALPLVAASLAVLPQMASRTDAQHVQFALTPALVAACAWIAIPARARTGTSAAAVASAVAAAGLVVGSLGGLRLRWDPAWVRADLARLGIARESDAARARARERVVAFVSEHTTPDEPVFVGCTQHELVNVNQMELYFLTGRGGATHYLQFEPNIVNREDVQERMIADFEARGLRAAVLSDDYVPEPNDSSKRGAGRLDAWLRERFELVERAGPYQLLLRRE